MNTKYFTFFFLIFISHTLYSQNKTAKDTMYIDEKLVEIAKELYLQKSNAAVFHAQNYEADDFIIYKILYKFNFGKITQKEYQQIKLLLENKSSRKKK